MQKAADVWIQKNWLREQDCDLDNATTEIDTLSAAVWYINGGSRNGRIAGEMYRINFYI